MTMIGASAYVDWPSTPKRVLFLGAGASYGVGAPLLDGLMEHVLAYAAGPDQDSRQQRLSQYLRAAHGIADLVAARKAAKSAAALTITDLLTTLDLAIADESSFGPGDPVVTASSRQLEGNSLRRVRSTIVAAIADCIGQVRQGHPKGLDDIKALADAFAGDTIITTNWDTFIDRALWETEDLAPGAAFTPARGARYTPHAEMVVNAYGEPLGPQFAGIARTSFLKLHGSLNFLCCPRCRRLIVNPVLDLAHERDVAQGSDGPDGKTWIDRSCWCRAEAQPLIVTPSYVKSYANLHLGAIWRDALQALAHADHWTFVGYSLPADDAWIRSLLFRALAWRRAIAPPEPLKVTIVGRSPDPEHAEFLAAQGAEPKDAHEDVAHFLELVGRFRAVVGPDAQLGGFAGGLKDWLGRDLPDAPAAKPPARRPRPPPPSDHDLEIGDEAVRAPAPVATLSFDGYMLRWRGADSYDWTGFSGAADESAKESVKDIGPTPQGHYTIDPANIEALVPSDDWGSNRVRLQPLAATVQRMKDCFKLVRTGMYVHGGKAKGTHGCIELNNDAQEEEFFQVLAAYGRTIDLEVKYTGARETAYEATACPY